MNVGVVGDRRGKAVPFTLDSPSLFLPPHLGLDVRLNRLWKLRGTPNQILGHCAKSAAGNASEKKRLTNHKALFHLQLNEKGVQTLSHLGETVRDIKRPSKNLSGQKKRNVVLGDEASHAQRGGNISAFVPGIANMAKNMMSRDMDNALQTQQEFVASTG